MNVHELLENILDVAIGITIGIQNFLNYTSTFQEVTLSPATAIDGSMNSFFPLYNIYINCFSVNNQIRIYV